MAKLEEISEIATSLLRDLNCTFDEEKGEWALPDLMLPAEKDSISALTQLVEMINESEEKNANLTIPAPPLLKKGSIRSSDCEALTEWADLIKAGLDGGQALAPVSFPTRQVTPPSPTSRAKAPSPARTEVKAEMKEDTRRTSYEYVACVLHQIIKKNNLEAKEAEKKKSIFAPPKIKDAFLKIEKTLEDDRLAPDKRLMRVLAILREHPPGKLGKQPSQIDKLLDVLKKQIKGITVADIEAEHIALLEDRNNHNKQVSCFFVYVLKTADSARPEHLYDRLMRALDIYEAGTKDFSSRIKAGEEYQGKTSSPSPTQAPK